MLKLRRKHGEIDLEHVATVIGESIKIEGHIIVGETMQINGYLRGDIKSTEDIIIGENGEVDGDITAKNILISGGVHGNLKANGKTEISKTGTVVGDITTHTIVVNDGSVFKGNCTMDSNVTAGLSGIQSKLLFGKHKSDKFTEDDA